MKVSSESEPFMYAEAMSVSGLTIGGGCPPTPTVMAVATCAQLACLFGNRRNYGVTGTSLWLIARGEDPLDGVRLTYCRRRYTRANGALNTGRCVRRVVM